MKRRQSKRLKMKHHVMWMPDKPALKDFRVRGLDHQFKLASESVIGFVRARSKFYST